MNLPEEEQSLRSVALRNAASIQQLRQRAEEDLRRARDALERKSNELAQSLSMMKATLDAVSDGIVVTDQNLKVSDYNEEFRSMWRLHMPSAATAAAGGDVLAAVAGYFDSPQQFLGQLRQICAAAPERSFDVLMPRDGRVIERRSVLQTVDGRTVGRVWSLRDVTERRNAEQAMERMLSTLAEGDQRKTEFLATLAHELRNPLAPIRNGLELLRRCDGNPQLAARTRDIMGRQLSHMVLLVDDLLDISRISRGTLDLKMAPATLQGIVQDAVCMAQPVIDAHLHTLAVVLPQQPVMLHADATRMAQVFSNLLNNAAKYTPDGGTIGVSATLQGDTVEVAVTDNGTGIEADALDRVFEMFVQVGRDRERARGGLGVGLSLVRRIVELHRGTATCSSDGPDQGSVFTLRLPLPVAADAQIPPQQRHTTDATAAPTPAEPAARRILVVDDNADGARTLAELLQLSGHTTHAVFDGREALAVVGSFRPDVVFLDIGMPGMDGYQVARALRQMPQFERLVLIALTGWGAAQDRERVKEAGFDQHLVKPIEGADIDGVLTQLVPQRA